MASVFPTSSAEPTAIYNIDRDIELSSNPKAENVDRDKRSKCECRNSKVTYVQAPPKWHKWCFLLLGILLIISLSLETYLLITQQSIDKVPARATDVDYPNIPFINGWTKISVKEFNATVGHFPEVDVYLHKNYIRAHIRLFAKGASFLIGAQVLDKYGRDLIGRPDNTQFVTTARDMDDILDKANGNITVIEEELGIPAGGWSGKDMRRIDILKPRLLHVRVPTGNEAGTNHLWIPGGYMPTGLPEAVIDRVPKGMYTETKVPGTPRKKT
ncbi:hypothetical protein DdX_11178 [Ditylenchus destructor]|uniref:Uncharacterized protein n=1 Tax=Ditylenchus destructor TaxID=166010 RepID=A0AAD4R1K1_9BILA|nr:hypothetical protein DdX_11178 [Ditylenchus destructor]